MLIRDSRMSDAGALLQWRNDPQSRAMFSNSSIITDDEHRCWYQQALSSEKTHFYIGEDQSDRFGVCRFDISQDEKRAEVSINLNPKYRGKGLSRELLDRSILAFQERYPLELTARVKRANEASLRIFKQAGFATDSVDTVYRHLVLPPADFTYQAVTCAHAPILYQLLKNREHKISHEILPSYEEHERFVRNHPYKHWYLVSQKKPIGTIYIQNDNSIGLNLENIAATGLKQIMTFLADKHSPLPPIPSVRPKKFFFNLSPTNRNLIYLMGVLGNQLIQISYDMQSLTKGTDNAFN